MSALLIITGAPMRTDLDPQLARIAAEWIGRRVIMGGTTAKIVARELNLPLKVHLERDPSGLPPTSELEGFDLVSEGVLTLMSLRDSLLSPPENPNLPGVKYRLYRLVIESDPVVFIEGMHINPTHECPNLPFKLERRSDLLREITRTLKDRYGKTVGLQSI